MNDSDQEALWVLRAQVGDREALNALLCRIQTPIHRYLKNMLQDSTRAEDVLQDVLLIVCRKLRTLRRPELFRPWVYRIASRQAFRSLRRERQWRKQVRQSPLLEAQPDSNTPAAEPDIPPQRLRELINQVSPSHRAVLVLHYEDQLPLREVAAALDLPIGTVKSRLARGLQFLRRRLTPD